MLALKQTNRNSAYGFQCITRTGSMKRQKSIQRDIVNYYKRKEIKQIKSVSQIPWGLINIIHLVKAMVPILPYIFKNILFEKK